jgi:hypothetical protein
MASITRPCAALDGARTEVAPNSFSEPSPKTPLSRGERPNTVTKTPGTPTYTIPENPWFSWHRKQRYPATPSAAKR